MTTSQDPLQPLLCMILSFPSSEDHCEDKPSEKCVVLGCHREGGEVGTLDTRRDELLVLWLMMRGWWDTRLGGPMQSSAGMLLHCVCVCVCERNRG